MAYLRFVLDNRRFLLFGFALTFFSSFGQTYFIGTFGEAIRGAFDLSEGAFGGVYSIATMTSGFCVIWLGRLLDRVDLRRYAMAAAAGLVAACLAMSAVRTVALLGVALFGLRLFGQGLISHAAITSMARYFDADRGKAMSIAGLGYAAGEAVLPLAAVALTAWRGWQGAWLVIAVVLAVVLAPTIGVLLRGHAERHRLYADRLARTVPPVVPAADAPPPSPDADRAPPPQWRRGEVLRDPRLYLLLPAALAPPFIATGLFFHQATLVAEKGWTKEWFAACFVGFAAAQLPASLLAGPLIDRVGARRLVAWYLAPMGLGLLALVASDHRLAALAFLFLSGITVGIIGPVLGALWAELYGVLHLGGIRAMIGAMMVFSTGLSPGSMGWLLNRGVTMAAMALACAAYVAAASLLSLGGTRRAGRG